MFCHVLLYLEICSVKGHPTLRGYHNTRVDIAILFLFWLCLIIIIQGYISHISSYL
jgi:hypothetical protein